MFWYSYKRFILGGVCALCLPGIAHAAPPDLSWERWFQNQIKQHPDVIAAKEEMNAVFSKAEGRERPLYNPEFETEIEREGPDNNYRIGVNQTIDWWDKRSVRQQQASISRVAAQQIFDLRVQRKKASALQTLIEWQAANQNAELARRQEAQLGTLLDLVKERQQAGDLGQVDAELAFLSLSQTLNTAAQAQVRLKRIEAQLREQLADWSPQWSQIPETFWYTNNFLSSKSTQADALVDEHPAVKAARTEWGLLQQSAELSRRETKAEPTFGIHAGKTGDENAVALSFSIPLNTRNNFSAQARAVSQEALSAQAHYRAIRRKQRFAIEASEAALQEYQQRFERWQHLMQGRGERSGQLLEKQWHSGDISTSEYLLALQQRTEGLLAGIELSTQFKLARIDWLLHTGQINDALTHLTR